jgi:hypothetical protein
MKFQHMESVGAQQELEQVISRRQSVMRLLTSRYRGPPRSHSSLCLTAWAMLIERYRHCEIYVSVCFFTRSTAGCRIPFFFIARLQRLNISR